MNLDERMLRLIAVGASIAANCQPCLEINRTHAIACGASEAEIAEAIWVGKKVRQGAASKMDVFVDSLTKASASIPVPQVDECGCN